MQYAEESPSYFPYSQDKFGLNPTLTFIVTTVLTWITHQEK